jgi:hypothetical protein
VKHPAYRSRLPGLGRNHAANVGNMEITGTPINFHGNFPHHWPTICVTLKTLVNHQAPANQTEACQGLTPSP